MTINEKLSVIQTKLIAPKNQYNSFGKYHYRSCEDILEGLKPHLEATRTAVTVEDEIVMIGERYYIKATATLHDCDSASKVSNTAYAREELTKKGMDASQITGATSSYARKYALNGLFCIDDVKDADSRDNRQNEAEENKKIENLVIDEVKVKALEERCKKDKVDINIIYKLYKVNSLKELTEVKYANIHQHWNRIKES